jgi:hypothetical protein
MVYCKGGSIMNIEEANKKIDVLDNKSWDLDAVISQVNDKTKEIKYNDVPSDIYIAVMGLAEDNGIEESELEYKINEVREKVNALESAIYDLVEPFEEKKREIDNEKEEIECDISDYEWEQNKC